MRSENAFAKQGSEAITRSCAVLHGVWRAQIQMTESFPRNTALQPAGRAAPWSPRSGSCVNPASNFPGLCNQTCNHGAVKLRVEKEARRNRRQNQILPRD